MFVIHQHNFFLFPPIHLLHNLVFQLFVVQQGAKTKAREVNIIAILMYLEVFIDHEYLARPSQSFQS